MSCQPKRASKSSEERAAQVQIARGEGWGSGQKSFPPKMWRGYRNISRAWYSICSRRVWCRKSGGASYFLSFFFFFFFACLFVKLDGTGLFSSLMIQPCSMFLSEEMVCFNLYLLAFSVSTKTVSVQSKKKKCLPHHLPHKCTESAIMENNCWLCKFQAQPSTPKVLTS